MKTTKGLKQNLIKLGLDLVTFCAFLALLEPRLTGIDVHEWLALAGAAAIVVHLLLNWSWIAAITRRFFGGASWRARLNYVLNWLLFIDGTLVMLTGLMISRVVLPAFGIQLGEDHFWRSLHSLTADGSLFILGAHVALHWDWIIGVFKRLVVQPFARLRPAKPVTVVEERKELQA